MSNSNTSWRSTFQDISGKKLTQPRWNIDLNLFHSGLPLHQRGWMKRMKAVGSRPSTAWHCEGGGKRCELYDHYDLMGGWVWMVVQAVWRKNETRMKHQWKPWCKQASSATNQTRVHSWWWWSSHLSRTLQYSRSPGPNPVRVIHSVASRPLRQRRGSKKNTDSQTITATHWTSNTKAGADVSQSSPSQIQGLSLAATKPAKETTQTTPRSQQ